MSLDKMNASFAFAEENYCEVIELLQNESKNDFEVIVMLGMSYFAVGDFLKCYRTFQPLFDYNKVIYKLPNKNRRECYPIGTQLYDFLDHDDVVKMMFKNVVDKLEREEGFNLYGNPTEICNSPLAKDLIDRYKGYANKYINLSKNDLVDLFAGLMFVEVATALSSEIDLELLRLKTVLLEYVSRNLQNNQIGQLFVKGTICVKNQYEKKRKERIDFSQDFVKKIYCGEIKLQPYSESEMTEIEKTIFGK